MNNKKQISMQLFINTSLAGLGILLVTAFIIAALKVEKQKKDMAADKQTIRELTDELHSMEVMYLKCAGSVKTKKHGAHYIDGKIKFYNY